MGNQNSQEQQKPKDDSHLYEYKRMGGVMVRVDKPQQQSFLDQQHSTHSKVQQNQQHHRSYKSCDPMGSKAADLRVDEQEESTPNQPTRKLQIIHEEETLHNTNQSSITPLYTEMLLSIGRRKSVRVYVDKDIEFNFEIPNDQLTCGWMLTEVTKRYTEELLKIKEEKELQMTTNGTLQQVSPNHKYTRKMIVTLKTSDQRESLDYWLTQYDRSLEVLENGDFLIAHFVKLTANRKKQISKQDFEQIKVIGRGGFSRVILVRKKDTGRLYAMKIMKKNKIQREKKLKPILSERKILEKLQHPFIIKLHWAFQSNEELFFVMDLCTGGEVFFHLNRLKRFTEEQAKFCFAEILLGIDYLHERNIVYRDIKPENILMDMDGHIRIADFGLSKQIPARQKSYSFCGSPEYMSPEMLQGIGHDKKVDIYCLGALLFEMLTGLPPFYNKDTNKMYENILHQELSFPDYFNPAIANLITGMMQKDPSRRVQSIKDIKRHPWLKDVQWDDILHKKLPPPIIPSVRDCHIDPDYVELPLDFEEEQYKVRLSTERRYSYYYESTLQSKSVTEQSFYNNFFEKNESGSGVVNLLGGNGSSIQSGVFNGSNAYGASLQSDQSQKSQDNTVTNRQQKNVLTGLENFTFIDTPKEEEDALKSIKKYKTQFEERKQSKDRNNHKPFSMRNLNQNLSPTSDKIKSLFNQKHMTEKQVKDGIEDAKHQKTQSYPVESSNKGNYTLSSRSEVTFEESNQSIAQEFTKNESIASVFGPVGNVMGSNIVNNSGSGILQFKQTSILVKNNNRLTIQEEEDDDLESIADSNQKSTIIINNESQREQIDNFSFKQQELDEVQVPSTFLDDHYQEKKQVQNLHIKGQVSIIGVGQTMTTATQSSQYTQQIFLGTHEFATSQCTEETPIGVTTHGCHTSSSSKSAFQIPQFGRSGSQTNNIVKQQSFQNPPLFVHTQSVKHQALHGQVNEQVVGTKDIIVVGDTRSMMVLTPTHPKKTKKPTRKATGGERKKSTNKNSVKQNNFMTDDKSQQDVSFHRTQSFNSQNWPSGRDSTTQKLKESPEILSEAPPQQVKKSMHRQNPPSYSLSPTNAIIAQSSLLQQHQMQQYKLQNINLKAAALTAKKKKPQQKPALNKHLTVVKKTSNQSNNAIVLQQQQPSSSIKSFLKAALPLSMQHGETQLRTPTNLALANETQQQYAQTSVKKVPQQQRNQKFRSMDMTQNLLKKSVGAKATTLKNNIALKQHILQIQTSHSPTKEQIGGADMPILNSQESHVQYSTFSMIDQAKNYYALPTSPVNLNSSYLTMHTETNTLKRFISKKDSSLIASKTPERKDSEMSAEPKLGYQTMAHKPNQLSMIDKKRRSDGSHQSISSIKQVQGSTPSQIYQTLSNKLNIFSTPKGSKAVPQNGYNSQRTVTGGPTTVKKSINQIKATIGGLSRNDLNQKKANTAQAVVSKKKQNI